MRAGGTDSARLEMADPVPSLRDRFEIPFDAGKPDSLYVCGHSLGQIPKRGRELIEQKLDAWGRLGVEGHLCRAAG